MWLRFRNWAGASSIFFDVLLTSYIWSANDLFFFYKLVSAFDVIAAEEIIQRSTRRFNLTLQTSGASSFQYQLANLLACSTFFLSAYFLLYLILELSGAHFLNFSFD